MRSSSRFILILNGAQNSNFPTSDTRLQLVEFYTLFRIQVQEKVSLEIKKKRGLSINLDIHHSKVPSSEHLFRRNVFIVFYMQWVPKKSYRGDFRTLKFYINFIGVEWFTQALIFLSLYLCNPMS